MLKCIIDKNRLTPNKIYHAEAFNQYGDVISHLNMKKRKNLKGKKYKLQYRYWEIIEQLNLLNKYVIKNDSKILYLFPTYAKSAFLANKDVILKLEADLLNNMNIEIINQPHDSSFSDEYYFDTVYHLNNNGRKQRTMQLIKILQNSTTVQKWLQKNNC